MQILIVAITFAVTAGGLFLIAETRNGPEDSENNYAQIIDSLQQTTTPSPTLQPLKIPVKTSQPTKRPVATTAAMPSPSPTPFPPLTSILPSPTSHLFYTSSYKTAKYYYCDTDSDWKNLSAQNLKSFSSPEELLKSYPNRTLHESCK